MTVHTAADTKCELCDIPFTKSALVFHLRRFHADLHKNDIVAKALQKNRAAQVTLIETCEY